ncbi:hypothetical protein OKW21_006117 [Catalinimonas alkaloidigena]|uniref:hypothetical protein n=1 Tax=Catalinimonas alkaloidigena TaxID=1075417 RepID=UPI002405D821|nr:hypothetical protein [Catalinimonas alkaloidigena]MDF9800854.1 hypothetical protein [Catalinimonas alkaloidigena]
MKKEGIIATLLLAITLGLIVYQMVTLSQLDTQWNEIETYTDEQTWTRLIPLLYYAALLPGGLLVLFFPGKSAIYLLIVVFMMLEEVAMVMLGLSTTIFPAYALVILGLLSLIVFFLVFSPGFPQIALTGKTSLKGLMMGAAFSVLLCMLFSLFF